MKIVENWNVQPVVKDSTQHVMTSKKMDTVWHKINSDAAKRRDYTGAGLTRDSRNGILGIACKSREDIHTLVLRVVVRMLELAAAKVYIVKIDVDVDSNHVAN